VSTAAARVEASGVVAAAIYFGAKMTGGSEDVNLKTCSTFPGSARATARD
jgi:hypothetical protein